MMGITNQDLSKWKGAIYEYEKSKRTKKPFGKDFFPEASIIKSQDIASEQRSFDPIIQKYIDSNRQVQAGTNQQQTRRNQLNRFYKYGKKQSRDYDIINLYGNQAPSREPNYKSRELVRSIYNPVNNQPLPDYYFRNRQFSLNQDKKMKNIKPKPRDFNIVTCQYNQDNSQKLSKQQEKTNNQSINKYNKTHVYDPVYGRYYDPEKQRQYEDELQKIQQAHSTGQKYNKRLPPTYLKRQPLVLDSTKPLSQSMIDLDKQRQLAKQRFKLKYLIEKQYQQRNIDHQQKREARLRNRVYNSHTVDSKSKQLELLNIQERKAMLEKQLFYRKENYPQRLQKFSYNPQALSYENSSSHSSSKSISRSSQRSGYQKSQRYGIKSGGFC